jgi:hypothetical protein
MSQPLIKFNVSLFHQIILYILFLSQLTFLPPCHRNLTNSFTSIKLLFHKGATYIETGNSGYLWSTLDTLTGIKLTPGSVNGDAVRSRFSSSVTSLTPLICTQITSFPTSDVAHKPSSPLRKSMQFCKSTTVMIVVFTHHMKLNTIRTISCSIKTDNSCCVQVYCIATNKIINTKKSKTENFSFAEYNG